MSAAGLKRGRKPVGESAMSGAQRMQRHRERRERSFMKLGDLMTAKEHPGGAQTPSLIAALEDLAGALGVSRQVITRLIYGADSSSDGFA